MILGKGRARTEAGIIREYQQFLIQQGYCPKLLKDRRGAPGVMLRRIGKPMVDWEDDEILEIYENKSKTTKTSYSAFLAFLFFYGYRRATIYILTRLPVNLSRMHKPALLPIRQRLEETNQELKYSNRIAIGSELNRLIWLLAVQGKQLEDITRSNFEAFRNEYQAWYVSTSRHKYERNDPRIARIERFLLHWKILTPQKKVFMHEVYFSRLKHDLFKNAILEYINWYEARSQPGSVESRRVSIIKFFLWLQESHPKAQRLDHINRHIAIDFLKHLRKKAEDGDFSPKYGVDIYRGIRLFFDFAVFEQLDTSPNRNPFGKFDVPKEPDPVPRYISDVELNKVQKYCQNGATLREKTIITILLHTGIRSSELVKLCTTDIVQIQGTWKLHIREGKGLKDRIIPLTPTCLKAFQEWQGYGWEGINEYLFTTNGRPWQCGSTASNIVRRMMLKIGLAGLTPHRFRHTFAVVLLNHGLRESAVQKLLGHSTLGMTLEYARILDRTVEEEFNHVVEKMQVSPLECIPNFFYREDYEPFEEADAINWIRLPHGYCRRHPKMHCESDVKCLICNRYCAQSENLDCLQKMHDRYIELDMDVQADVVYSHINILKNHPESKVSEMSQNVISV